jgi:hypothetical protein
MTAPQDNKAFVLTAIDALFNQRDYAAARLAEHWDVIQDGASCASSKSGLPMLGDHFPD